MWSWFTAYIFDIGLLHVRYGQLTPVKTRYLLSVSHEYIAGSGLEFIKVTLFLRLPLIKSWFSIGSRAHVGFICCNQGWVVQKLRKANP